MAKLQPAAPAEGQLAPDIRLETEAGEPFELSSLRGRRVVLYFYPKADTPGCTVEACEFRDVAAWFAQHNAVIVGISPDRASIQARFRSKYGLPFILLCDFDKVAARAYGVWKEKTLYGKKMMGVERSTFLIGEDGRVERVFLKVKPHGHAGQVLETLARLTP